MARLTGKNQTVKNKKPVVRPAGGAKYHEFASNIHGEILANFDADDSLEHVLIYKNQISVDIKKHSGCIYFVHPDNKKSGGLLSHIARDAFD
eukprot:g8168.t1